jgi:hypothetical protein
MKNTIIKYCSVVFAILLLSTGCKKYLDQVPNDRITIEEVFKKKAASENYLANVYTYVDDEADQENTNPWLGNADEADITWSKYDVYKLNVGNIGAGSVIFDRWGHYYNGIRAATYFINHIGGNAEILRVNGQQLIDQYKAEARFLRAYYYFLLMRQYGPVVLVGDTEIPADATADAMQFPRSSFDDCVNYVSSELDKAASVLPRVPSYNGQPSDINYGRATVGAALAVKAKLLLYAASPLYNGNTDLSSFKNKDGKAFINQAYDATKWKKAADAAKAVIDLGLYTLYKDPGGDPIKSLQGLFFIGWNPEQIFVRKDNALAGADKNSTPRQAGGWNGVAATQEQVDGYFMSDGQPIHESSLYSETGFTNVNGVQVYNMYVNREPRFYASIIYNNAVLQEGNMQSPAPITFYKSGTNGMAGHPTDWSKTGYLIRKNVGVTDNQTRPEIIFRLGEIYLDYVEALNEYAPGSADILSYLNLIRERAGIPQYGRGANPLPVPPSLSDMRTRIWQERRVELAFESNRWFDIRRWKIAASVMGDMHGMDISKDDNTFYKRVVASNHLYNPPASNWFPISQYDLDRSKLIVQNPGW